MSEEKKNSGQQKKNKDKKEKNELDKELRQTFPASDPPSHSRPGHERTKEDDS
ncbi:MAG: hypothetical protein R6V27_10760 [Balneolaceae bacterium]